MNLSKTWRPPGWQEIEEGVDPSPESCVQMYDGFKKRGYYTRGGALTEFGSKAPDSEEAEVVRHNVALLRDAWNTFGAVWKLGAGLVGVDFKVDPFNNPGATDLPGLVVKLDGVGDQDDDNRKSNGLARSKTTVEVVTFEFVQGADEPVKPKVIELPLPANWRGHGRKKLKRGQAPAAANGPHSFVEAWLKLCVAQGQQEIVAAFVPDNGDGWFQRYALTAQLVVRLGRVPCSPPPAIPSSSPRGASALLIWVPVDLVSSLPEETRKCVEHGENFRVPLMMRPRSGIQYAFVQRGAVDAIVDLGLV